MKTAFYTFLSALFISFCSHAEEAQYSMDELLLNCNLIAHVKITGHTNTDIGVRVLEVLHHYKSGIKKGDYLRIQNDFQVVCPLGIPLSYAKEKRELLVFLSFHQGKWYISKNQYGIFNQGKVQITFFEEGYSYTGTMAEWKTDLRDYFEHFNYNQSGQLVGKHKREALNEKTLSGLVTIQYTSLYLGIKLPPNPHVNLLDGLIEPVENETVKSAELTDNFYSIVEHYPISEDTIMAIMDDLARYVLKKHPETVQKGIKGKSYYTLYFEKDGSISDIRILKSLSPEIDAAIKAYYAIHHQWSPALLKDGTKVRCQQNFPLNVNF